jgi:hypothetical protein
LPEYWGWSQEVKPNRRLPSRAPEEGAAREAPVEGEASVPGVLIAFGGLLVEVLLAIGPHPGASLIGGGAGGTEHKPGRRPQLSPLL